jgi:polar amino acid transport system substrate-binding protein
MARTTNADRRDWMRLGLAGVGGAVVALAGTKLFGGSGGGGESAPVAEKSRLRTVLERGKLIVGTGSTNAPWHFEDEKGQLTGMDIAMGRILAKGLFDDENKIEFVIQDSAARIPNIASGKVDITIQFMTVTAQRAQLAAFTRPYYVEGIALLAHKDGARKTFEEMLKAGAATKISILQNADAENNVRSVLPQAQVLQIDTQANVIQALDSKRVDGAAVDLSNMAWLVRRHPDKYVDAGKHWQTQLYSAAVRQGDPDWLQFVNTVFNVAMHGNDTAMYDKAFKEYFGVQLPGRVPGFPNI